MQRILAIAWLTWKAAFRFRLFLVVAILLLASVVGLPLLIKDDGTARGFTQILLTYTLTTISALFGISTLWLACGTGVPLDGRRNNNRSFAERCLGPGDRPEPRSRMQTLKQRPRPNCRNDCKKALSPKLISTRFENRFANK